MKAQQEDPAPPPTRLEELPVELLSHIGKHIIHASVTDPANNVADFACNQRLQSALWAELAANEVLQKINAAQDFPALCSAIADIPRLLLPYQQDCLIAAIHLLPRLGLGSQVPEALWSQLAALLPPQKPRSNDERAEPFEPVVHALIESLRPAEHGFGAFMGLETVLATLGADAKVSPQLETALIRWAVDLVQWPGLNDSYTQPLQGRLLAAAPDALRPRLRKLFDFFESRRRDRSAPTAEKLLQQMKNMEAAAAAGDPDLRLQLRVTSRTWFCRMRDVPGGEALFRSFFSTLAPEQQMWLVQWRQSPLKPDEIMSFLGTRVGQVPGTVLLEVLALDKIRGLGSKNPKLCAALVCNIVEAAMHTPQRDAVLSHAITYDSVCSLGLSPFLKQCIKQADESQQLALTLRLGLAKVGYGEFSSDLVPFRSKTSALLDTVLNDSRHINLPALEAILELRVAWLDDRQKSRLIERIRQMPPAHGSHCLARFISQLAYSRQTGDPLQAQALIDACWNLPPEHRAKPVAALLDVINRPNFQAGTLLLQSTRQLHGSLPPVLRPTLTDHRNMVLEDASR